MDSLHTLFVQYAVVQLLSVATLPAARRLFHSLPDRGYCFSKSFGLFLLGLILWLGTACRIWPRNAFTAWLLLLSLGAVCWGWVRRSRTDPGEGGWNFHGRLVFSAEVVFFVGFLLVVLLRLYDPAANHTEQPMDLMMSTAVGQSRVVPVADPWLSGYPISYYYFGYWLSTLPALLSGQPPELAYNVAQALWFGLLLMGVFGLGVNLVLGDGRDSSSPGLPRKAAFTGGLAALAVGLSGNLYSVCQLLAAQQLFPGAGHWLSVLAGRSLTVAGAGNWWWWWSSSRVVQDTDLVGKPIEVITEFPAFSYLLGDNHPHLLAMPYLVLVVALSLNLVLTPSPSWRPAESWMGWIRPAGLGWGRTGWMAALAGSLIFANSWDFPAGCALLLASYWMFLPLSRGRGVRLRSLLLLAAWLLAGCALLYWPYLIVAESQVHGLAPNLFFPTRLTQLVLMFGPLLGSVAAFCWHFRGRTRIVATVSGVFGVSLLLLLSGFAWVWWSRGGRMAFPILAAPLRDRQVLAGAGRWARGPFSLLVLVVLLGLTLASLDRVRSLGEEGPGRGTQFALLLCALGLALILAPELVYLRDSFETRMNTVFKLYYEAWLMLGVGGTFGILRILPAGRAGPRLLAAGSLLLILLGLLFPASAGYTRTVESGSLRPTLNALDYLRRSSPAEYGAVRWIRSHALQDAVVLQAAGASYRPETGRISALTGRSTLLGWAGHERQWRGRAYAGFSSGRAEAIRQIYTADDLRQVGLTLQKWGIDYVFVGPVERQVYGVDSQVLRRLERILTRVYQNGEVRVYARRDW